MTKSELPGQADRVKRFAEVFDALGNAFEGAYGAGRRGASRRWSATKQRILCVIATRHVGHSWCRLLSKRSRHSLQIGWPFAHWNTWFSSSS